MLLNYNRRNGDYLQLNNHAELLCVKAHLLRYQALSVNLLNIL